MYLLVYPVVYLVDYVTNIPNWNPAHLAFQLESNCNQLKWPEIRELSERNKSQTEKSIKVKMIAFAGWQLWVEGQVSLKTTALMMEDVSAPSADSSPGRNWSQSAVFRVFTLTAIQLLLADDVQ